MPEPGKILSESRMSFQSAVAIALIGVAAAIVGPSSVRADGGTDDPDFDYLPPQSGFFGTIQSFTVRRLRLAEHPSSYPVAKRLMYELLADQTTLYCGCIHNPAERDFEGGSCGYVPRNDNDRARRVEAEHILPAFWIAEFREEPSCWVAHPSCGSGRECCLENDANFSRAHNDLVNLYPAIGELNGDRSNLIFDLIEGEERLYGSCDFEVDRDSDTAEPREEVRGDIARVYFYMAETYDLSFPDTLSELLDEWDEMDPVSQVEIERNDLVHNVQGSSNRFVSDN